MLISGVISSGAASDSLEETFPLSCLEGKDLTASILGSELGKRAFSIFSSTNPFVF